MIKVDCKKYEFDLPVVKSIQKLVHNEYEEVFFAVIVHGSVGTNEVVYFSDFDGLLIVKDKYKGSRVLKSFIRKSMKLIYKFDPLQHHGWFIIYRSQLKQYPQTYFPYELFNYARSIFPEKRIEFDIFYNKKNINYVTPLLSLISGIDNWLEQRKYPTNMYSLKSFLSQFMLLPALYVQARDNKGIFKKYSFESAKKDFDASLWSIQDEVSLIRKNWNYNLSSLRNYIMTKPGFFWRRAAKTFAPGLNKPLINILDNNFYKRMLLFAEEMRKRIVQVK